MEPTGLGGLPLLSTVTFTPEAILETVGRFTIYAGDH
jgi:hypothetical protein